MPYLDEDGADGPISYAEHMQKLRAAVASTQRAEREAHAAELAALRNEAESFQMAYRMKCDEETKALEVQLAALRKDADELRTVMIAAAEEIAAHWEAHCDAEGYGPQNLMHRLKEGIPSEYGYTPGAFEKLRNDAAWLRNALQHIAGSCEGRAAEVAAQALGPIGAPIAPEHADTLNALSEAAVEKWREMMRDAARYRKWRAAYTNPDGTPHALDAMLVALADAWSPEQVDAAIDAAMQEQPR